MNTAMGEDLIAEFGRIEVDIDAPGR